jgi:hypothetical protein
MEPEDIMSNKRSKTCSLSNVEAKKSDLRVEEQLLEVRKGGEVGEGEDVGNRYQTQKEYLWCAAG